MWPSVYSPGYYPPAGVAKRTSQPFGSYLTAKFMLDHGSVAVDPATPVDCPNPLAWSDDDLDATDDAPPALVHHATATSTSLGVAGFAGVAAATFLVALGVAGVWYRDDIGARWGHRRALRGAHVLHNDMIEMDEFAHPSYNDDDDWDFDDDGIVSPSGSTGYLDITVSSAGSSRRPSSVGLLRLDTGQETADA